MFQKLMTIELVPMMFDLYFKIIPMGLRLILFLLKTYIIPIACMHWGRICSTIYFDVNRLNLKTQWANTLQLKYILSFQYLICCKCLWLLSNGNESTKKSWKLSEFCSVARRNNFFLSPTDRYYTTRMWLNGKKNRFECIKYINVLAIMQ